MSYTGLDTLAMSSFATSKGDLLSSGLSNTGMESLSLDEDGDLRLGKEPLFLLNSEELGHSGSKWSLTELSISKNLVSSPGGSTEAESSFSSSSRVNRLNLD